VYIHTHTTLATLFCTILKWGKKASSWFCWDAVVDRESHPDTFGRGFMRLEAFGSIRADRWDNIPDNTMVVYIS
jgi:hypothetical protein